MSATIDFNHIRTTHNLYDMTLQYLGRPRNGKWLCPFHKERTPSFCVKGERFKCFGCGLTGDVVDFVALMEKINLSQAAQRLGGYILDLGLSPAQIKAKQAEIRAEYQRRRAEQQEQDRKDKEAAIERISQMVDRVEQYQKQVDKARPYWHKQGLDDTAIGKYRLGYCPKFPLWEKKGDEYKVSEYIQTYTIPYFEGDKLIHLKHRLHGRDKDKYRPEISGLPHQLFNADILGQEEEDGLFTTWLEPGEFLLVEGEVKAMYLTSIRGFPSVAIPGAQAWQDDWMGYFAHTSMVYVVLDPDAEQKAKQITYTLNSNGINAEYVPMTCKPDDLFVKFKGNENDFLKILEQGRRE